MVNYVNLKRLKFCVATARAISSACVSRNLCCPLAFHPHESSGLYSFVTSDLAGRDRHAYGRHRHCVAFPLAVLWVCATGCPGDPVGRGCVTPCRPPSATLRATFFYSVWCGPFPPPVGTADVFPIAGSAK